MKTKLPHAIETYISAVNAGDAATLHSTFADDAVVKDVGQEFRGAPAIKEWAEREIFAANVRLGVIGAVERAGETIVTMKIDGTFDRTGLPDPLLMDLSFVLDGDKITVLTCRLAEQK